MAPATWKKYSFEFLSIFVAVISAFALNNWNDNRRDTHSEQKILGEIHNGLQLDLQDISINKQGHRYSLEACNYFRHVVQGGDVNFDSLSLHYIWLVRDYTSIMNLSGYQSLKSKGLEIISNDSIRLQILALYDHYYQIIYKLEETAPEMQSFQNYFSPINEILHPHMKFDDRGNLVALVQPLRLSDAERKELLSYLWRLQINRMYKLERYGLIEEKVAELRDRIENEIY